MAHRQFVDARGATWDVWDVHPAAGQDAPADGVERKAPLVQQQLADGWLCFESAGVKRRLAPVPPGWAELGARELANLCARAVAAPRRRSNPEQQRTDSPQH